MVFLADEIVVYTMRRGGMYQSGTRFQCDMLAANDGNDALVERMLQQHAFQRSAFTRCCHAVASVIAAAKLITRQA